MEGWELLPPSGPPFLKQQLPLCGRIGSSTSGLQQMLQEKVLPIKEHLSPSHCHQAEGSGCVLQPFSPSG